MTHLIFKCQSRGEIPMDEAFHGKNLLDLMVEAAGEGERGEVGGERHAP
jgi:hypothetical protein